MILKFIDSVISKTETFQAVKIELEKHRKAIENLAASINAVNDAIEIHNAILHKFSMMLSVLKEDASVIIDDSYTTINPVLKKPKDSN